jgi:hypothetical protein
MRRRDLLENVRNLLGAGAAAAIVPVVPKSAAKNGLPRLEGQRVHWVSPDRRHIEAVLIHRYQDGSADLLIEERPAEGGVHFLQTHPKVRHVPNTPDLWGKGIAGGAPAYTWHEPEPYAAIRPAKPYAQWWLKRKEPATPGELFAPKPDAGFPGGFTEGPEAWDPPKMTITLAKDGVIVNSTRPDPDDEKVR